MENGNSDRFKILTAFTDAVTQEIMQQEVSRHQEIELNQLESMSGVPRALRQETYDLLILDIGYQDSSVERIMHEINQLNSNQAFIIVTSNPSYDMVVFSMESGALDFFRKPLDEISVGKILRNHKRRILESRVNLNLNKFITYKNARIELPMDINILPQASNKITAEIYSSGIIESSRIYTLNLAVFECLTNALEHGNLGIGYDRKTEFIKNGDYLLAIKEMSREEPFNSRKIYVNYIMDAQGVRIEIEDEGNGFDVSAYLNQTVKQSKEDYHGRGLILAMKMVDDVQFNEKGNKIILKLNKPGAAHI